MAKRILFVVGPALGHVVRSLVIANALISMGPYEISFTGVRRGHGQKILSGLYPFYELPETDRDCIKFADALEILFSNTSPDLICLDLTPNPWLLQVRFPDILQVYLSNFFLTQICSYKTHQEMSFKHSEQRVNEIRNSRGLEPILNIKQMYNKDKVILCDPTDLITSQESIPSNFHIVGQCIWEPNMKLPEELNNLKDVLLISFGSTGEKPIPYLIVENIAAELNTRNIIWVGNKRLHEKASTGTFKHRHYTWLPTSLVLARSKFVITQGGTGSTYQAMTHGKPIGVWPSYQNQKILGTIIQEIGCGKLLSDTSETTQSLEDDFYSMQSCSRDIAKRLSKINGPMNAAKLIMQMLR
jgi:UDP:flavonoid glycosyltransferase YjiC (YdhE family)